MNAHDCKHYRHVSRECAAGVSYATHTGQTAPGAIRVRLPCRHRIFAPGTERFQAAIIPCALREEPTTEEVAADEAQSERDWEQVKIALDVASRWRTKPKPTSDRCETVQCPCCKGELHLFQSSYNGHVHGHCETANCVRWRE